jgi:hypothetical protein
MTAFLLAAMGASAATMEPVFDATAEATVFVGPIELHNHSDDNGNTSGKQITTGTAVFVSGGLGSDNDWTIVPVNGSDPDNDGGGNNGNGSDDSSDPDGNNGNESDPDPGGNEGDPNGTDPDPTFNPSAGSIYVWDPSDYQYPWQLYVNDSDDGGGNNGNGSDDGSNDGANNNGSDDADDPGNDDGSGNGTEPNRTFDPAVTSSSINVRNPYNTQYTFELLRDDADSDGANNNGSDPDPGDPTDPAEPTIHGSGIGPMNYMMRYDIAPLY